MKSITTLPNLGKSFEMMKAAMTGGIVTCTCCGNSYHDPKKGTNPLNLRPLVQCFERPNNQECYPFYGCPVCGTDDYLK